MSQQTRNEDLVVVSFFAEAALNHGKSAEAGRPIFDDVEMIRFNFAGDTKRVCVFPAHEADCNATRDAGYAVTYAEAYPEQYRKFRAQEQQMVSGTPISEAPFLTEGKRRELRALNIHSIEALAALDGPSLKSLGMGGREWKNQAVSYLQKAQGSANVTALASQVSRMQETINQLMAENARLNGVKTVGPVPSEIEDEGAGGLDAQREKAIEDCSDEELREFIKASGGKVAHNAGRAKLIEIATELAAKDEEAA